MIDIRLCAKSEVPKLMEFINKQWSEGHSLATSRALMDWQHEAETAYHYLMAWDGEVLLGVLGYIPTRRYDKRLSQANVLWLALWKIHDQCKVAGLGLRMLRALEQVESHIAIAANGINFSLPPIYKALGYTVVELMQFYMTNPSKPRRLLQGWDAQCSAVGSASCAELTEFELRRVSLAQAAIPEKTSQYFIERFLRHPFYNYNVYLLSHEDKQALVATRIASHEGHNALRIVDFAGDPNVLSQSGRAFLTLMEESDAEYADFWQCGLPEELLHQAGFALVKVGGPVTVPNYFEPFIAQNSRILCAYKTNAKMPFVICRADGDQDRPNQVEAY